MKLPQLKSICLDTLNDMKAKDVLSLDIRNISTFADWFIIATASSSRNAKAISNKIIEEVDVNGDGEINFEEFCTMMVKHLT